MSKVAWMQHFRAAVDVVHAGKKTALCSDAAGFSKHIFLILLLCATPGFHANRISLSLCFVLQKEGSAALETVKDV